MKTFIYRLSLRCLIYLWSYIKAVIISILIYFSISIPWGLYKEHTTKQVMASLNKEDYDELCKLNSEYKKLEKDTKELKIKIYNFINSRNK